MPILDFTIRALVAIVAGGVIGLEREINNKSAGLRTNALVAVSAAIFVLINLRVTEFTGDPSRIIGQIVTGIGFLGAGVIMHRGINVQGLTTAATIWCSAAVGCLAGLGMFLESAISVVLIVAVNASFKKTDAWFLKDKTDETIRESENDQPFEEKDNSTI